MTRETMTSRERPIKTTAPQSKGLRRGVSA
jgi:hypothetical protein